MEVIFGGEISFWQNFGKNIKKLMIYQQFFSIYNSPATMLLKNSNFVWGSSHLTTRPLVEYETLKIYIQSQSYKENIKIIFWKTN